MTSVAGPSWDLSTEYLSPTDPAIDADLGTLSALLDQIEEKNQLLTPLVTSTEPLDAPAQDLAVNTARDIYILANEARKYLANPSTYASCVLSVESNNKEAKLLSGRLTKYRVRFGELMQPSRLFLDLSGDDVIASYLAESPVSESAWAVNHSRGRRHELLSLNEENLVSALSQDGIHAWGRLYTELSGKLRCLVAADNEQREVGIAEAAALMQSTSDRTREDAWQAINKAWSNHEDTCAAAINALAGWRLEMCKRRSHEEPVHFLDTPAHASHIKRQTLDAIIQVAAESKPMARRAAKAMARAYGKRRYGPWDNRAPAPVLPGAESSFPFEKGLEVISHAYGEVDPSMGEFVNMMAMERWIEGTIGPHKRPGAYCTSFAKSKTPRVYMTYGGSMSDITVLAHELGHAFHHWAMKDLPDAQRSYGMSLAETASTFGETLVRDAVLQTATNPQQALSVAWEEMSAIVSFLLNIPTRFEFEKNFFNAREARPLLPTELRKLMSDAWTSWYGDALSEPDELFWISKLHFFISGISFYNFPYLFGYLFSQSIYQRRASMGDEFFARYSGLLRDTGRMSAEDLAREHLDGDLTTPEFWRETVNALEARVTHFEALCDEVCA